MNAPTRRLLHAWFLALATAALLVGGCTTMEPVRGPSVSRVDPVVSQAAALLAGGADAQQVAALLGQLDDATLAAQAAALPEGDPLYNHMARALLARGLALPRPMDRAAWGFDADGRPPADRDGYRPPVKLGVLLPLSGDMAAPAAAVRDGFLTAYYAESRRRPDIAFYDTHGTAGGALAAYDQAASAGNDFIVGPLSREGVDALFRRGSLPVAMLALNQGNVDPPAGNVSFSLSPEEEGVAAADLLVERGARRVMVINAGDDNARRSTDALRARLAELGGTVTDVVGAGIADLTPFAQKEGGVDAIYLAMRGPAARELMPRLAMAGLSGKPLVATSQLLSGTGDAEEDRVLDGIAFPAESWTSGRHVPGLPSAASVSPRLQTARGAAARLFAFGHDAWLLTAYLERLAQSPDAHVAGATGGLAIDASGKVLRTPAWSTFRGGYASPLASAGN
ncbi:MULTISPECIES: penicillin-binding protein activator [Lysobacteraceae]|uniref:Penicillin-binding protein activator n=1 Tax=Novilysobacter avium TaxID=2781023 RepID=A0A7S6UJQ5_9GAMM|nr:MULTISPECIES: penicillin-binding protein activator [Lysobacter]QOW21567.1 penicillin-binding protein activator [Lysobacter avium]QOY62285.1 penicillin-binding protein activator [Lysobacter sp. H21R4]